MVGIKHHTQGVGANDATKQVSVNAWQEAHDAGAIADVLTDHNKAAHDALGIDADTLDTKHAADFADAGHSHAAGDAATLDGIDSTGFALATQAVPTGAIFSYGGAAAPSGYVLCDGTSYERVGAKAALFAAIGTAYGAADGDHFNVPDLQSKFPIGKGGALALGDTGGATTYTHAGVAISAHDSHTHTYTDIVNHVHVQTMPSSFTGSQAYLATDTSTTGSTNSPLSTANPTGGKATGTTNGPSASLTHSVTSSGNDHTGVQPPYQVVNYIIKT